MSNVAELIKGYRERVGLSQNALARSIGVNPAYINRLEKWGKGANNKDLIEQVAAALGLSSLERDKLLVAAGHLPIAFGKLGAGDETLLLVADILSDDSVSARDKRAFRLHIRLASRPWREVGL